MTATSYSMEEVRRLIDTGELDVTAGLPFNNIADPSKVDNKGDMQDCYVGPYAELSIGEGSVVRGCRFTGKKISIGSGCTIVNCIFRCNVEIGDGCKVGYSEMCSTTSGYATGSVDNQLLSFGNGCVIRDTKFDGPSGAALVFGSRAYICARQSFEFVGANSFGDDCRIYASRCKFGSSCIVGNRFCFKGTCNPGNTESSSISARSVRIGNDVRIVGAMNIRNGRRLVIGDRSFLCAGMENSRVVDVRDMELGTEAVVVLSSSIYGNRGGGITVKVGGRGRLEIGSSQYYGRDSSPREIVVASNESLSLTM